ncbi:hypothetical protein PF005_g1481 [Phytophthora fragariae]|uniref:Anaphase-promoting complex subunit 4 n=1 Tax=Phytophthora fragariae TaxID=53985 RepID=A0A6A3TM08_9STRA|nr:hypothetical protein PF011_g908 [Phytophthora fragariae]KAE9138277.1 hypothetical protein PF007_g1479 [Phytophthora fragariae]KAE9229039.1 hypothetical protein PF004_g10889 [Phytophthora fragariae]KAE9235441.1 hypothetical protein PF005_g1481 [Phytophthora fragariae]KAE9328923.1 hypothetical protein PF001_g1175 [Phytophthora fragariae]
MLQTKRAFVALQDRFVSSLAVACCPTMDLVAVLTLDHHLLVHRTTSWQKLLHIKPSDVGFEMVALAWKPDGLQLAVGCDEGDVAIFEIESGEIIPERRSNLRHEHRITAMHWAEISEAKASSSNKRRHDWGTSQSKKRFQRRSSRFLAGFSDGAVGDDTVLVTADEQGFVALWWMGRVLLTRIDVSEHFSEEEYQVVELVGGRRNGDCRESFQIERVDLAPDLSVLFVLLVFSSSGGNLPAGPQTKLYRLLTIDLTAIQRIHEDVTLVADTVDRVQAILDRVVATGKQMTTEWKNATRIFELKMGLIGSLYEKYACEDPPQVDMLSVAVTGITSPALAQYFAQDIQEMSIHRMQKALFSGCDTLRTIAEDKMKQDLVDLLFLLSEMRGRAKWSPQAYATTLGISEAALNNLISTTQNALLEMEKFTLALHETRQDFALFFQWILERIRVHSNTRDAQGANAPQERATAQGAKSLLNLRRLCNFLQRAAEYAQRFREQQPNHNKYKVETTFGNLVSRQLSTQPVSTANGTENPSNGCLSVFKNIPDQWLTLFHLMAKALGESTAREKSGCFSVGNTNNLVEECHVHFRHTFSSHKSDLTDDDDQGDDENQEEAVDWSSLKHFGPNHDHPAGRSTILMGFRLRSGILVLLRANHDVESPRVRSSHLVWNTAVVSFSNGDLAGPATCQGFDFYGDATSGKDEQLALVLDRKTDDEIHQEWLYLQAYDHVEFSSTNSPSDFEALLAQGPSHTFRLDQVRGRAVSSPVLAGRNATSVFANASRGVLCVMVPPSRLAIFDAEDSEDEDQEDEGGEED